MESENNLTRRAFVHASALTGVSLAITGCASTAAAANPQQKPPATQANEPEEDVAPAEDLMREHGVLKRVLLVYREGIRRLQANADLSPDAIAKSATIIRTFIEDYHEKLEEDYLFPRFRKANVQVELVNVLQKQHEAGRKVTDQTIALATMQAMRNPDDRHHLVDLLAAFIRMYEPHEAREDTVLFPAFRSIVSLHEYDSLGEDFEKIEHQRFGEGGFEEMVDRVAAIEKSLGIYDLDQFTPHV